MYSFNSHLLPNKLLKQTNYICKSDMCINELKASVKNTKNTMNKNILKTEMTLSLKPKVLS